MFLATLDTPNFRFTALGSTEQEARGILGTAWLKHEEQAPTFLTWEELSEDVNVQPITLGSANRDGSHLVTADTWTSASRQTFIDTGAYLPAAPYADDLDEEDDSDAAGSANRWNTSPAEPVDYTASIDHSDLSALALGRPVRVEVSSTENPHNPPVLVRRRRAHRVVSTPPFDLEPTGTPCLLCDSETCTCRASGTLAGTLPAPFIPGAERQNGATS